MNIEMVRMNLTGMAPGHRQRLADYCDRLILRSLLPPQPTPKELADATQLRALISEVDGQ
jgi:hypothetical protein